jgi:hypothetical protein
VPARCSARLTRRYRPLAIAPPDGNYGQAGTNDRRIPRELLARLRLSIPIVFTQDSDGFAEPGDRNPIGRIAVTRRPATKSCARLTG